MRSGPTLCLLALIALTALGCSRTIVEADNPAPLAAGTYQDTYEASIDVLRDFGFVIDRRDYRFGRITTLPLGSPNLFEIWSPLNTTRQQAMQSTLASEQRRVNIIIERPAGLPNDADHSLTDAGYTLEVQVVIERKQIPTRRLAGSARRNVFSNLAAAPQNLNHRSVTTSYWQPVGQDPYLEARLVKQITERAGAQ
jgi:hypothetical protein